MHDKSVTGGAIYISMSFDQITSISEALQMKKQDFQYYISIQNLLFLLINLISPVLGTFSKMEKSKVTTCFFYTL